MKEKIFIDIDEVVARTIEDWVYPMVNRDFWTNFSYDTTTNYRDVFWNTLTENWKPIDLQRKIQIFNWAILTDSWKNLIRPVHWALEKILDFSNRFEIWMLTARHSMLHEYTKDWVWKIFNWVVSQVFFSNCYHGWTVTKSDICIQEWVKIMIEDDIDYSLELANNWIKVFLLSKPWNIYRKESHSNIVKVDSWEEIIL